MRKLLSVRLGVGPSASSIAHLQAQTEAQHWLERYRSRERRLQAMQEADRTCQPTHHLEAA